MEKSSNRRFYSLLLTASSVTGLSYLFTINKSLLTWVTDMIHWCPTSPEILRDVETKMLSYIKKPYEAEFIPIKHGDENCHVRSLIVKSENEDKTPIVLLHGFASGIGLWILNIDALAEDRPVYALDILGFGSSSRPHIAKDAEEAENQFVESIEQWRKNVGLNKFILLGHSMGGFLATSYAIRYPDNVKHLILADAWGFPSPDSAIKKLVLPIWVKAIAAMLKPFNPLAGLRAAGPWGPQLIQRLRPDILQKFESIADTKVVSDYIYHCNAQCPSGESAFKSMSAPFGWAKRPMIERITELRQDVPITFIYGARSWVDSSTGHKVSSLRKDSFVEVQLIQGSGHHVYADKADEFSKMVVDICRGSSENKEKDLFLEKDATEAILFDKNIM